MYGSIIRYCLTTHWRFTIDQRSAGSVQPRALSTVCDFGLTTLAARGGGVLGSAHTRVRLFITHSYLSTGCVKNFCLLSFQQCHLDLWLEGVEAFLSDCHCWAFAHKLWIRAALYVDLTLHIRTKLWIASSEILNSPLKKSLLGAKDVTPLLESLPSMRIQPGVESQHLAKQARQSEVQSHPWLCLESCISMDYLRPCLRKTWLCLLHRGREFGSNSLR